MTTLFVIDDHKIVRDGIKAMLIGHHSFKVTGVFSNAEEVFHKLKEEQPNICLLDIQLPGRSGLEIAEEISEKYPFVKIIISTALNDEYIVRQCREIGVAGMVSKESGFDTFIDALEAVKNGKTYYSGQFTEQLIKSAQGKSDKLASLTEREVEFIKVFSKGFSHKEIANKLNISPRTVEVHKKNVMDKLGMANTIDLIKFAIKEGLVELL